MRQYLAPGLWRLVPPAMLLAGLAIRSPQQFYNGVFSGSIYALFAVGYTLVFGVLDILNLAHQAIFMLGAVFSVAIIFHLRDNGLPPPFAWLPNADGIALFLREQHLEIVVALVCALLLCGLIGIVLDRVAFRPLRDRADTNFSAMISSIAVALMLEAIILRQVGPNSERFPFGVFPVKVIEGPAMITNLRQVMIIATVLGLTVGLQFFLLRSRTGRAIRAVAENPRAARLLGVNVERIIALSFFISSALGGLTGALYGLEFGQIQPYMGRNIELKGLAVIILGGMGSIPGAALGGLLLGLTEAFTIDLIPQPWGSGLKDAAAFTVLFVVLLLRPRGLLGRKAVREA